MQYSVYGLKEDIYQQLVPIMKEYNEVVGALFSRDNKEKIKFIKRKNDLKSIIYEQLKQQVYLGMLQADNLKEIGILEQLIHKRQIEELLAELENNKIIEEVLKKALVKEMSICLWME